MRRYLRLWGLLMWPAGVGGTQIDGGDRDNKPAGACKITFLVSYNFLLIINLTK